jgi:DNA-binding NarL/FixJ family response regulator
VLVADDHPQLRTRVVSLLADEFTVIGTVSNGADLIEAEANLRPDVVVVDISMPGMNGLEATGRMRRRGSDVAVVYLTAHHEDDILEAAWKSGALGFVQKTAIVRDLVAAVRAALEGRRFPAVPAALDSSLR